MIIKIHIPENEDNLKCVACREQIEASMKGSQKISQEGLTIEFPLCREVQRILVEISTRHQGYRPELVAERVGKIVERVFGRKVEVVFQQLDDKTTAVYLTE